MSLCIVNPSNCSLKVYLYSKVPSILLDCGYKESLALFEFISYRSSKARYSDGQGFVLCHSVKLKKLFGSNYSSGIKELENLNLIEPKWHFDEDGNRFKYCEDKGIASSYKITSFASNLIKEKQYHFVPNDFSYKIPKRKNGKFKLETESKNPKNLKLLDAYQGITIDPQWIDLFRYPKYFPPDHYKYPLEPIARTGFFYHSIGLVESILQKTIPVKTDSDCGRAFHPIIELSKILRPYIRKNGEKLINIDCKSFHPFLIASCIADLNDRNRYLALVRGGFYEIFIDESYSRDMNKVALQKYLSGRPTKDSKVLEIAQWYKANFPDVPLKMRELKKKRKTFQMYLQQLESRIFVDEVFMKAEFWCLPMHDGLSVLQMDVAAACELINRVCESRLGYSIQLESD
jgi:hypothetical protein